MNSVDEAGRTCSFDVVVFQRTAKKCTKTYNARAHLLFFFLVLMLMLMSLVLCLSHKCEPGLNLLFGDVLVAVVA